MLEEIVNELWNGQKMRLVSRLSSCLRPNSAQFSMAAELRMSLVSVSKCSHYAEEYY